MARGRADLERASQARVSERVLRAILKESTVVKVPFEISSAATKRAGMVAAQGAVLGRYGAFTLLDRPLQSRMVAFIAG